MKRAFATLLLLPLVASAAPSKTAWATVSGYAGSTTLTNFPVLVKISESAVPGFRYADCAAGGADLSFADAAGNALSFDVDTWNTAGTSYVWVLLPEVAPGGATAFKVGWADPNPAAANPSAVWTGSAHKGVWHMNSASPSDASGSGNNGTAQGSPTVSASGRIGSALNLPTTSDYVACGSNQSNAELKNAFTVEAWVKPDSYSGNRCFLGKDGFISLKTKSQTEIWITTPGKLDHKFTGLSLPAVGTWWHVAMTFQMESSKGCKLYVNGAPIEPQNASTIVNQTGSTEMWLGKNQWGENYTGLLDEMRLAVGIRSADWIAADCAQVARDDFIEFGAAGPASMLFFF